MKVTRKSLEKLLEKNHKIACKKLEKEIPFEIRYEPSRRYSYLSDGTPYYARTIVITIGAKIHATMIGHPPQSPVTDDELLLGFMDAVVDSYFYKYNSKEEGNKNER